jgi:hypothetical protein
MSARLPTAYAVIPSRSATWRLKRRSAPDLALPASGGEADGPDENRISSLLLETGVATIRRGSIG